MGHFQEGGIFAQVLDLVAPVAEDALFPVEEGNGAVAGPGVAETRIKGDRPALGPKFGDVQPHFPLAAADYGQLVLFAV
ncbi:MAG: hypothetical protein A2426_01835 [Candidatus Lambdaproteobacteria bacterium RIFOXYC1_FULL_56_13]|nr:MAG: hypothetical protein A2426_01835 [Candidatus Lambdaproteobacteria bacterium RIFOXYC1_FULL_56_13]